MFFFLLLILSVFSNNCTDTVPPADIGATNCWAAVTLLGGCSREDLRSACTLSCGECACEDSVCNGHGTTTDLNSEDGCVCDCDSSWTGDLCDTVRPCDRDTDCNGAGETTDTDSTDGCVCVCDTNFGGPNCDIAPPSQRPSIAPIGSTLPPTCSDDLLSTEDHLGSEYIKFNLQSTGLDYDTDILELVVRIPNQHTPTSWSFPNSYDPTITTTDDGCFADYVIEFPWDDWQNIGEFSSSTNRACSTLTLETTEDFNGNKRDLAYDMPYCLQFTTNVELSVNVDVKVNEPNFLQVMTYYANTHPDFANDNAEVVFEFTTQVAYPWVVSDTFTIDQLDGLVSDSEALVGGSVTCDGLDYCWRDWELTFRIDDVCVRKLDFSFTMEATYSDYVKTFTIASEIYTEASCAAVIDTVEGDLTAEFQLFETNSLSNEMYRFHINSTLFGQIQLSDNLAEFDTISFSRFELVQEGLNSAIVLPYTILANAGGIVTFSMETPSPPMIGSIGGISSRLEIDLEISYVRRRLLHSNEQQENAKVILEKIFLTYLNSCTYPFGTSGSPVTTTCDDGTASVKICDNGSWIELSSCAEKEEKIENVAEDNVHFVSSHKNSDKEDSSLPWMILFFTLFTSVGVGGSYFAFTKCSKPQVTKAGEISYQ